MTKDVYNLHGKPEFWSENQIVRAGIPFRKFQKIWSVISGYLTFPLHLVCLAYLGIICGLSFSHRLKFDSLIFLNKISTLVVCINA